eukprot:SAG22_NODE_531_length_9422_cov_86.532983_4_plen_215_part_00
MAAGGSAMQTEGGDDQAPANVPAPPANVPAPPAAAPPPPPPPPPPPQAPTDEDARAGNWQAFEGRLFERVGQTFRCLVCETGDMTGVPPLVAHLQGRGHLNECRKGSRASGNSGLLYQLAYTMQHEQSTETRAEIQRGALARRECEELGGAGSDLINNERHVALMGKIRKERDQIKEQRDKFEMDWVKERDKNRSYRSDLEHYGNLKVEKKQLL